MGNSSSFGPIVQADERYALRSRSEILSVLRALQKHGAMITLYFDPGREFLLTTILAVNPESDELILDLGADARANKLLIEARQVHAVGNQDRIRIEFVSNRAAQTTFEKRTAFSMGLPSVLTRLQRRDCYRLDIPKGGRVKALLQLSPAQPKELVEAELLDISCGGVAIIRYAEGEPLSVGTVYPACTINLPSIGTISAPLEICSVADVTLRSGTRSRRIGCRFVNLTGQMQTMIQRFINNVERERARLRW
ncbi:MAG: flagellar brake protein [Betaproteobacteria bacterium]|nr:flagellar brake protein [Betaproteobacteria bacterium]